METRKNIAAEKKASGRCNCAMAVLSTYSDFTGLDEAVAANLTYPYAAGMANMEGTCGAVVGAGMVLGLSTKDRAASMRGMKYIMNEFQKRNGATQCKQLKGVTTGVVLRECPGCVADACELLESLLPSDK